MPRVRVLLVQLLLLPALAWAPVPAQAMEEAERLWLVGERAFQDGLYALSRRVLERFVERFGADRRAGEAMLLLGKARLSQGELEPAAEAFRRAQAYTPPPGKPEEARFWEAETLFRLKRFSEARALYDRILAESPASPMTPDALYGLAWANLELNRRDQAVSDLRQLLWHHPDHPAAPSAQYYLARTLTDLKRADEAVPLLREFRSRHPEHRLASRSRFLLGQALVASGAISEGLTELRAFVAANPRDELVPQARRLVVETLLREGRKAELLEEYKELVSLSPATPEALYDAGVVAARLDRPKDAERAWGRLRKEFPEHPLAARAALDLAHAAFGEQHFKEASWLARVASKGPEEGIRAEALLLVGESDLKLKRWRQADEACEAAAEVAAEDPGIHYRAVACHGLALEEQRQWKKADERYALVEAKSPDKTLRAWAKERRGAIAARLKPAPASKPAPKSSPKGEGAKR